MKINRLPNSETGFSLSEDFLDYCTKLTTISGSLEIMLIKCDIFWRPVDVQFARANSKETKIITKMFEETQK
jgi:hypothetical protein